MIKGTVILCQYNPDKDKLFHTIESVLMQRDVDLQLIISDDGSELDFFEDTERLLKSREIENYRFCKNSNNKGTVLNIWNAIYLVDNEYVILISPGDCYYDESTLHDMFCFMANGKYLFAFGKLYAYKNENGEIKLFDKQYPYYQAPYRKTIDNNYGNIEKYLVFYHDCMIGGTLCWEKNLFIEYMKRIVHHVTYAEDLISIFAIMDKVKWGFIDRYIIWYEYGNGISTKHSGIWRKRLVDDLNAFFDIAAEYYSDSKLVRRAQLLWKVERIGGMKAKVLKTVLFPDRFMYILIHGILIREKSQPVDTNFLIKCISK